VKTSIALYVLALIGFYLLAMFCVWEAGR